MIAALGREGTSPLPSTPEEFAQRGAAERETWEPIVRAALRNRPG